MSETDEGILIAEGNHLRLMRRGRWEYVERRRGVAGVTILAVNDRGELILTEQYRPSVRANVIDLPAGLAGDDEGAEDEELAAAAARELLEETGYQAREMRPLPDGPAAVGISNEFVYFFRAVDPVKVGPGGGDAGENITVHEAPLNRIHEWLSQKEKAGNPIDLKVHTGLYFAGVGFQEPLE